MDINAKTENGITPLHIASFKGDTEIVRLLIQNGADTNADVRGWRALDIAKKKGYMEIVDLVNEANNWLLDAAKNGDLKLLKKLHRNGKGVPLTVKDAEGWTALHQAAVSSQNDRSKLHKLSLSNQIDITKFLIDNGVNTDEKDVDDWTPLMVASVNGHTDIVKTLIEKGADVNARDKNGMTALHGAAVNGYYDIAELLVNNGAEVNAGDKNGMTPLKMAESVNRTDMIDFLIRHCAEAELEKEGQVEGLVKDALTNQPLSGTSIKVFQQGKLVKACVEKTG
ncbi:ankyrin repeat protein, partial [Candidatus Thiomargarita nelsonii]